MCRAGVFFTLTPSLSRQGRGIKEEGSPIEEEGVLV